MEKMNKKAKRGTSERDSSGLTLLPEPMFHHIQSFLTGKDAARSSCIFKSWYDAYLSRPTLTFDERDFKNDVDGMFKTMMSKIETYKANKLRIESFSLRMETDSLAKSRFLASFCTVAAVNMGATDINIEMPISSTSSFVLPPHVLESETLTRLCMREVKIYPGKVRCSRLKSLTLQGARLDKNQENLVKDVISCCRDSLEELSILAIHSRVDRLKEQFELDNLRSLYLSNVDVGENLFLASRFPCLKDLTIDNCEGFKNKVVVIASTSLERISFVNPYKALKAEFVVPNLRKFVYSGCGLPSLSFKACASEWESEIGIQWTPHRYSSSWFLSLKTLLTKLRRASSSRISLSITPYAGNPDHYYRWKRFDLEKKVIKGVEKPLEVENLTIHSSSSEYSSWLLLGLFRVCRPAFIVHASKIWSNDSLLDIYVLGKLKDEVTSLNLDMNMEFYDEIRGNWQPFRYLKFLEDSIVPVQRKIRIRCIKTHTPSLQFE